MKLIKNFILISLASLVSCTKVINIDLNSADPKVVIEGVVTGLSSKQTVTITKTVNFNDSNTMPAVSSALVTISDNTGQLDTLKETSSGVYTTENIAGVYGRTYILTVIAEGKTFTAQSTMPFPVNLDSLYISTNQLLGGITYSPSIRFYEPAGKGGRYRFIRYYNGKKEKGTTVISDEGVDGIIIERPITSPRDNGTELKVGDLVEVDFLCTDDAVYTYFNSLQQNTSGDSAAPDNPVSNISNGALGYFSAHTVQRKSTIIK